MKRALYKLTTAMAALALFAGVTSVNYPSFLIAHQPKVPSKLEQYKK